jgi:hypothetical protein
MSATVAIAKREIKTYFYSPIPYIVATVFVILTGFFCFLTVLLEGQAEMRGYFGSLVPWLLPILMPAISMRLLAEEKGSGSLEMLITMPVRDWEVVVGKFLAALAFLAVMVGLTGAFAVSIAAIGPLDKSAAMGAYIGMFLQAGAYVAIGLMAFVVQPQPDRGLHRRLHDLLHAVPVRQDLGLHAQGHPVDPAEPGRRQPLRADAPRGGRFPRRRLLPVDHGRVPGGGHGLPRFPKVEMSHGL